MRQWYSWLYEMKKKDEGKRMEEHQKLVSRLINSADGGTLLLHRITKPAAWRGGAQIMKEKEEDAKPLARCEKKRKEWADHVPWLMESDLEKAARNYKAKTEVGCDGFHPKVSLGLTGETRREKSGGILGEGGTVREMATTSLRNDALLDSKEYREGAAHRALQLAMVRWWEAPASARGGEIATDNIVLSGMPRMGAMEELSSLCGRLCCRWTDSTTRQEKKIKEQQFWS